MNLMAGVMVRVKWNCSATKCFTTPVSPAYDYPTAWVSTTKQSSARFVRIQTWAVELKWVWHKAGMVCWEEAKYLQESRPIHELPHNSSRISVFPEFRFQN